MISIGRHLLCSFASFSQEMRFFDQIFTFLMFSLVFMMVQSKHKHKKKHKNKDATSNGGSFRTLISPCYNVICAEVQISHLHHYNYHYYYFSFYYHHHYLFFIFCSCRIIQLPIKLFPIHSRIFRLIFNLFVFCMFF